MVGKVFKNKKVTVMGLGLHGGGVASVNWLVKHGAKVTVTDLKTRKELQPSIKAIKRYSDKAIKLILGKHREIDFNQADLVVQNPGVPRESKYLKIARKTGILIENDASIFFKYCPGQIIGVTGTRGKSTTATLVYELLRRRDVDVAPTGKAWLAGLPQKPMLEILDRVKPNDIVILELSSWQLEILGQQKLSPRIAVITNIYPDHLNRYSGMKEYIAAKKNIFRWQNKNDLVVLNLDNPETKKIGKKVALRRFWFSKKYFAQKNGCFARNGRIFLREEGRENKVANIKDIKLAGEHNLENVLAALAATGFYKVSSQNIKSVLNNFSGLPGRLELVEEKAGIKYINDTTATTPDGTMAALKSLKHKSTKAQKHKNIILIAGGETKNIPAVKYRQLAELIKKSCKAVILFSGKGSDQLIKELKAVNFRPVVFGINKMTAAVMLVRSFAKTHDIVLLSPACASFNLFTNEFDRGDQFEMMIKGLK